MLLTEKMSRVYSSCDKNCRHLLIFFSLGAGCSRKPSKFTQRQWDERVKGNQAINTFARDKRLQVKRNEHRNEHTQKLVRSTFVTVSTTESELQFPNNMLNLMPMLFASRPLLLMTCQLQRPQRYQSFCY